MALSVVVLNVVLTALWLSVSLPPRPQSPAVPLALFAVALVLLVAAPAVKRAILKRYEAEGFDGDHDRFLAALSTATIVAFALREAAGLLGFMLALLTGNPWWSWGLSGAALLAMFVDRPVAQGPK
jgi:hypothetical protein